MSVGRQLIIRSNASQCGKDLRGGKEVCYRKGLRGEEIRTRRDVDGNSGRPTVTVGAKGVDRAKMGARDGGAAGTCKRRCAGHVCGKA